MRSPYLSEPPAAVLERPGDVRAAGPDGRLKFARGDGFQSEVRRRVDAYFRSTGRRPQDCPAMYGKTAVVLAWLATSYVLLVFVAGA
jgi:hypothetical protein